MEPAEYQNLFLQEETHWWYRSLRDRVAETVSCVKPPKDSPLRILDAGCGTGGMMVRLAGLGEVHGIDFSPDAIRFCAARGLTRVSMGSVAELPYENQTFDVVVSLDVLYHMGVTDDIAALREFGRVLKPGGQLILNLAAYESLKSRHDLVVHTRTRYRKGQVSEMLRASGFSVRKIDYWNTFLFLPAAVVRLAQRLIYRKNMTPRSDVSSTNSALNRVLFSILRAERIMSRLLPMPFGLSIFSVAVKS